MEENSYVKRQRFYKGIMLVLLTAFITFILTSIFISNQLEKDGTTNNSITSIFQGSSSLQKSLETIEDLINDKYLYEVDEKKSIEGAIEGYVASLGDPYTQYVPADEMEEYTEAIMGNYVGIGIYMTINTEKNLIQVIAPIRESPAEEAGIKSGDFITKINGENYTGDDLTKASNIIKGEEGTKVTLEILRGDQTLNIEVERRNINTNPVYEDIVDGDIGYLGITSVCPLTAGLISINAKNSSSSYTFVDGISPLIILQNIQSLSIYHLAYLSTNSMLYKCYIVNKNYNNIYYV